MLAEFHPFAISLILGLLIGIERERSHPGGAQTMGVRTFPLVSLLGTLAAYTSEVWLSVLLGAFSLGLILIGYLRSSQTPDADFGLTTETAAAVVFATGYIIYENPALGAALGMAVLAILISRKWLHRFVTSTLRSSEVQAASTLLILGFGVAPFLPNEPVDPWGLIVPRTLAMLTMLVGIVQFSGYALMRAFGARAGMALSGLLGGLVSSTAVFFSLGTVLRMSPASQNAAFAGALLAIVGMTLELLLILAGASLVLLQNMLPVCIASACTGIAIAIVINRTGSEAHSQNGKPLDWKALVKLTLLIFGMLAAVEIARRTVGAEAVQVVSFLTGLFEVHGISLATAVVFSEGKLVLSDALLSLKLALLATYASKLIILWITLPARAALQMSLYLLLMLGAGIAAHFLF